MTLYLILAAILSFALYPYVKKYLFDKTDENRTGYKFLRVLASILMGMTTTLVVYLCIVMVVTFTKTYHQEKTTKTFALSSDSGINVPHLNLYTVKGFGSTTGIMYSDKIVVLESHIDCMSVYDNSPDSNVYIDSYKSVSTYGDNWLINQLMQTSLKKDTIFDSVVMRIPKNCLLIHRN